MSSIYEVSVVMPALDEGVNLLRAVTETQAAFEHFQIKGEIILVNDGSSDNTGRIAEELKSKFSDIKVIHHKASRGIGASFWDGVQSSGGDVVTMLPGDGENDPKEILRYLPLMKEVDIVIPFVFNQKARGIPRRGLSKLYKAIINLTFGMLLNYMNGTVMYRRSVLQCITLRSTGFFYQTELLIKAIRLGFLYAEVPCALGSRASGDSKAVRWSSLLKLSRDYLSTVYGVYFSSDAKKFSLPADTATKARHSKLVN